MHMDHLCFRMIVVISKWLQVWITAGANSAKKKQKKTQRELEFLCKFSRALACLLIKYFSEANGTYRSSLIWSGCMQDHVYQYKSKGGEQTLN